MPAVSSDHLGRVLSGRYRLVSLLGVGASAQVYLAEDTHLHRQVAVKVLHDALLADPVVRRRFATEAKAAANLNHPHLLAVYDVGDDGGPYLVAEHLAGGSLRSMLDAGNRLSLSQALLVALEAVRGLEHAHRSGLVHRDIKPANLLFGADGRLRIADFGLARVLAEAALTEPSASPLGTARYASPEQARGDAVSPASDLYSLTLVIVEAVTGTVPFDSETAFGGLVSRTERSVGVPDALGALKGPLARAGRLDPSERPDAGELAVSLLAAAGHLPKPAPLPLPAPLVMPGGTDDDAPAGGDAGSAPVVESDRDATDIQPTVGADATVIEALADTAPVFADDPSPSEAEPSEPSTPEPGTGPTPGGSRTGVLYDQALEDEQGAPRRGLAIAAAVLIAALVAGVAGFAWWSQQVPTHTVPLLVGAQQSDLDALVGDLGWELTISEVRLEGTEAGEIVDQDPAAGVDLAEGEVLRVVVSLGPPLVVLPEGLVGQTLEEVTAALADVGLVVGTVTPTFDEEVPAGVVLAIDGDLVEGAEIPQGSPVDLTVSEGPAPREVPDLSGLSRDEAAAELSELGLDLEFEEESSRSVDEGLVLSSSPAAGDDIERGGMVTVVVSSGLPMVEVPDVVGMDVDEATEVLEDSGLAVSGVDGPPNREVVSTSPSTDESVREGSEVTLITRPAASDDDEDDD